MADIVVLSHVARSELWGSVPDLLGASHRVTFMDVPGFGDTPLPVGLSPSIEAMAEGVRRQLAARGLVDAHLVGLSMAGTVALEVSRTTQVASVTAISPPGFWSGAEAALVMAQIGSMWTTVRLAGPLVSLAGRPAWLRAGVWRRLVAHPERVPAEAAAATVLGIPRNMRYLTTPTTLPTLARHLVGYRFAPLDVEGRVTVAWGDRDVFTSFRTQAPRARDVLPGARHVTLRGCGHVPIFDDPEQVARVILESVDGHG
jgi:pimeloyl-ACP methyl ester carboxylesterase